MNTYCVEYTEETVYRFYADAMNEDHALQLFEEAVESGEVDFLDADVIDSDTSVSLVGEQEEPDLIETVKQLIRSELVANYDFGFESEELEERILFRDDFIISDKILYRTIADRKLTSAEKYSALVDALIGNYIGYVILDGVVDQFEFSEAENEELSDRWEELEAWANSLDIKVDIEDLVTFVIEKTSDLFCGGEDDGK